MSETWAYRSGEKVENSDGRIGTVQRNTLLGEKVTVAWLDRSDPAFAGWQQPKDEVDPETLTVVAAAPAARAQREYTVADHMFLDGDGRGLGCGE